MKHVLIVSLALWIGGLHVAARENLSITPKPDVWGGASINDVRKILYSTASELWPHAHDQSLKPIQVTNGENGPIVYYERAKNGDYRVKLDTGKTYWSQYAFQFAHEFCHILCHYQEGEKSNLWFEESLCELASLYTLRAMSRTWETHPPYPNWKDYRHSLYTYAEERINTHRLPDGTDMKGWLHKQLPALRKNPTDREKNSAVAIALLPIFEANPEAWRTVAFLNTHRNKGAVSFEEHLRLWEEACPPESRMFVGKIRARLLTHIAQE